MSVGNREHRYLQDMADAAGMDILISDSGLELAGRAERRRTIWSWKKAEIHALR